MKPSKPPALATWLLEHARFSTADGVIAGDLLEEFNRGRSAAWYWRQVLMAIVVGCASEVRHRRVVAIRAVVITWAVNYGAIRAPFVVYRLFGLAFHPALVSITFSLLGGAASGALVALLQRKDEGRHPARRILRGIGRRAMLLTCAGALLGWAFMAILFLKKGALQHPIHQILVATIVYYLVALTGFAIGALLLPAPSKPITPRSEHGFPVMYENSVFVQLRSIPGCGALRAVRFQSRESL
jgi:hypothetical protein